MVSVLSLDEVIQEVVGETVAHGGSAGVETHTGLGLFDALRREFPQASIMTINLAALLAALDEAATSQDA